MSVRTRLLIGTTTLILALSAGCSNVSRVSDAPPPVVAAVTAPTAEVVQPQPITTPDIETIQAAVLQAVEDRLAAVEPTALAEMVQAAVDARLAEPTADAGAARHELSDIEAVLVEVYRRANPSVVYIIVPNSGSGSGFVYSDDGHIVTNNHVIDGADADGITVRLQDDTEFKAKLIGKDPKTDLALLKIEPGNKKLSVVKFGDSGKARVGDWVLAIGNPFGLGGTVTAGIVSAQGRDIGSGPYDDFLQIDAAVNRGNSGGPTFNQKGEVVGVNTAIFSPSGGNVGIAFAVPASTVEQVVTALKKDGTVARGFIGVQIQPVTAEVAEAIGLKEAHGALVAAAERTGPAARAGIRRGDTILAVDGVTIKDARDLSRRIASFAPGTKVKLSVWRDGKEREIAFEVGRQPAA